MARKCKQSKCKRRVVFPIKELCREHYYSLYYQQRKQEYHERSLVWAKENKERVREIQNKCDRKRRPYTTLDRYLRYNGNRVFRERAKRVNRKWRSEHQKYDKERKREYYAQHKEEIKAVNWLLKSLK